MQIAKSKTAAIAIAIFLMLSMSASMMLLPNVNAHTPPWTISTYAFINVAPNPVGVGQTVYVHFWIDKVPPTAIGIWGTRWHNFEVNVTGPNGYFKDLGTFNSDPTGGTQTSFVPDQVGNYTFNFSFPGQVAKIENPYPYALTYLNAITYAYINDTYLGSSASTTLTVQQQPISSSYPATPLPTSYWTRPINSMNREWSVIGGNWLGLGSVIFGYAGEYDNNGNFNPYTAAPASAHVMWTKPMAFGGQIGGEFGSGDTAIYATGTAYEPKFGSVILNGVLYYTQYPGAATNFGPLTAVDLRTGQTIWTVNASNPLACGMIYDFSNGNQYGAHAYLFTGPASYGQGFIVGGTPNVWSMYDAMTGQWILNIANPNPGTLVEGPNGELLSYTLGYNGMLSMWNISKCIEEGSENQTYYNYSPAEIWRPPQGATIDWNNGYEWSVPVATSINGAPIGAGGLSLVHVSDNVVLLSASYNLNTGGPPGGASTGWRVDAAYSAIDGSLLWGPENITEAPYTNNPFGPAAEGVYTVYNCQSMTWSGYSLTTGQKLWGPTQPYTNTWGYFDNEAKGDIAYGNLYTWSLNGEVHAYNLTTGVQEWSWSTGNAGVDTPYGIWPLGTWPMQHIIADGLIYVSAGHDYTPPVFKGAKLYCINATTGKEVWDSLNFDIISSPAIADGIMVWLNGYDNQIYAYGQGPSATTVSAPQVGITTATPVTFTGTVLDVSAGSQQEAVKANFPYGLPCVSDASMTQFMEAVYQQQPMPTNITGVPVTLSVTDSNGNHYNIGTTTTNPSGTYGLTWTPSIPGNYTVTATFAGTQAYYGSYATTYFYASSPAPTAAPTASPPSGLASTGTVMLGVAAIIIVIIVCVVVLAVLMLRKRP